jgi:hypothetical protein
MKASSLMDSVLDDAEWRCVCILRPQYSDKELS